MDEDNCSSHGSDVDDMDVDDSLDVSYTFPEEISEGEDEDDEDAEYDDEDISLLQSDLNFVKMKIVSNTETYIKYNNKIRVTSPYITKFEKTRVLGIRATQIEGGAKTLLSKDKITNIRLSTDIAELEYEERLIPFIIRRYLPDGQYEDWKLTDFHNV